ncbi:uncharacterized protein LOC133911103 [Phragmites australis]|uniref:uncharacterized protein LOC133911103 n=1 Tax=Phragmites australis TaxID=29695 RepID=UPI002D7A2FA3|nr:uncharacterized protein LOC133911103 [Phragmites australis]
MESYYQEELSAGAVRGGAITRPFDEAASFLSSIQAQLCNLCSGGNKMSIRMWMRSSCSGMRDTCCYICIFAESVDELMPEPTEPFTVDQVRDILMRQCVAKGVDGGSVGAPKIFLLNQVSD